MADSGRRAGEIELVGLSRRFGDAVAVDAIDLRVGAGEFFCLLGPSGSGRTTTLRMIAGLDEPSSGRILIDGEDMSGVPARRRPVNTLFQGYTLFPFLDVAANVAFGLRRGSAAPGRAETAARVRSALAVVQMSEYARRRPSQLSGGQQQRVALARALVLRPRALLLDEPLGALDAGLRRSLQSELRALQQQVGVTFVYVTHDPQEALSMADRIAVMHGGRIAQVGTARQVYEEPADAPVAELFGPVNLLDVEVLGPDGALTAVRLGSAVLRATGGPAAGSAEVSRRAGSAALVAVRPERIRLLAADPDAAGSDPGGVGAGGGEPGGWDLRVPGTGDDAGDDAGHDAGNTVTATVERVVVLGASSQLTLRLADGTPLLASLGAGQGAPPPGRVDPRPGSRVRVQLPADALRLLPARRLSAAHGDLAGTGATTTAA